MLKPPVLPSAITLSFPAAFGRLCVETPYALERNTVGSVQPPSGGCVLKQLFKLNTLWQFSQPPSGGCVLKHKRKLNHDYDYKPAAFGRLCVETAPI